MEPIGFEYKANNIYKLQLAR